LQSSFPYWPLELLDFEQVRAGCCFDKDTIILVIESQHLICNGAARLEYVPASWEADFNNLAALQQLQFILHVALCGVLVATKQIHLHQLAARGAGIDTTQCAAWMAAGLIDPATWFVAVHQLVLLVVNMAPA
jgi:hypothetical protein